MEDSQKGFVNIVLTAAIIVAIVLVGAGAYVYIQNQSSDDRNGQKPEPVRNKATFKQTVVPTEDYCKPDEDPDFKLANEDASYYYYSGNKSIHGRLYQQNQNSPITFGHPCNFELTKNYVSIPDVIKKDFNVDTAWKNEPQCNLDREDEASLYGEYTIHVKGFKISKSYIQQYDPKVSQSVYEMNRYHFYLDYDGIEKVNQKSVVKCPQILY